MDKRKIANTIKGTKKEMTQIFTDDGRVIPVTVVLTADEISVEMENKKIVIIGVSKGKGFAGGMKRWNFKGQEVTRGMSDGPRKPGSVGAQTPGRVLKGKKMAGRLGGKQVSVKGSKIVKVDLENKHVMVSGPIPGARNSKVALNLLV